MNDIYSENLPMDEATLKPVLSASSSASAFSDLKVKYGSDYAGCKVAAEIYQDFNAILRSGDT